MPNNIYNYHDIYKKYDMTGVIHIGNGTVKVHDIFDPLPDFMHEADVLFCDPPCNRGNLKSFYTKAELESRSEDYAPFENRLFEVIDEINPIIVFIEVFKANKDTFIAEISKRFSNVKVFDSMYYKNPKNKCWIIVGSNETLPNIDLNDIDEEKVIEKICFEVDFKCIADPCMGKGLVGFYANKAGKRFVGTELNSKRLAVLLERVSTGERGKIN